MQYLISILLIFVISIFCFFASHFIGYRITALLLLVSVSIIAMLFEIMPVLVSSILSALIWNFFFIPPLFTFHIGNTEDTLMFLLYFIIAMINGVLTIKIRKVEKKARDEEEKEKTIKLYNTLLNSLSHELRTPIATILGSVDILKDNRDKLSLNSQNELLHEIDIASLRLNRQVNNLLSMSRLESGMLRPKLDWCDLNDLINSEISRYSELEQSRLIFATNDSLPLFKLDGGLLEQIIHNLIHNAIVYTTDDVKITIEVKHYDGSCLISVSDNGIGFPEKEITLVFDKFYRLPHSKAGGSGLGLSIVKGFVEAQNGSIQLENNPTGGAHFLVSLPADTSYINNLKHE